MRLGALILSAALALPAAAQTADQQTLADLRQDMIVLKVELGRLSRELTTTNAPLPSTSAGSLTARTAAIESELSRLTAQIETLEYRITQIVRDGTNRLDDLQFRLCDLTPDCDISALPPATPLGGETIVPASPVVPTEQAAEMAIGEAADLAAARALLEAEDYPGATAALQRFLDSYPQTPLMAEAQLYLGRANAQLGDYKAAAKAYLDSYTADPNPPTGDAALTQLGLALGQLGQFDAACKALSSVPTRFEGSEFIAQARAGAQEFGCPAF
jgi:TolA-binding protein